MALLSLSVVLIFNLTTMAANTNATTAWRAKWFSTMLQETLHNALVCEKICAVDRSNSKYIWNPYGSTPTTTIQNIAGGNQGTYSVSTYTSTDDTLTVTDEFVCSEHIFNFEKVMYNGDIIQSRMNEIINSMRVAIDKFVLNNLAEDGTGTYSTPAGGFTTAGNVKKIVADLVAKVSGYDETTNGYFLVLENTDVGGVLEAQMESGFSYADSALNNGLIGHIGGVDIYVVRGGTFVNDTLGSTTVSNSGHRVFGVKGITTYAQPQDITWEEKLVTATTGVEIVGIAYIGFKAWFQKKSLIIDITLV